jgi:hypothetical protein
MSMRLPDLLGGLADRRRGEDLEIVDAGRTIYDARPGSTPATRSRARCCPSRPPAVPGA